MELTQILEYVGAFILGLGVVSLYVKKLRSILKESAEALLKIDSALSDGKLTKEEIVGVWKECKDVVDAVKGFKK